MLKSLQNEGNTDRMIRVLLGAGLGVISFLFLTGLAQIIAYILAAILIITGIVGFCLIYKIFGINTLKK